MSVTLHEVVPWGRSLDEYQRMFQLVPAELQSKILGCGDGPASFNCELSERGGRVTSCDPIYAFSAAQIAERVHATYDPIITQVKRNAQNYMWRDFGDPDQLGRHRLATMQRFLADFEQGKAAGRYLVDALPQLSFVDSTFDLALCSHLLFLYSAQLSLAFHLAAINELCRVAPDVRIFPLLALDCQPSPHLEPVQAYLASRGLTVEQVRVAYEFQVGGHTMLRITRARELT